MGPKLASYRHLRKAGFHRARSGGTTTGQLPILTHCLCSVAERAAVHPTGTWTRANQTASCFGLAHAAIDRKSRARPIRESGSVGGSGPVVPPTGAGPVAGPSESQRGRPGSSGAQVLTTAEAIPTCPREEPADRRLHPTRTRNRSRTLTAGGGEQPPFPFPFSPVLLFSCVSCVSWSHLRPNPVTRSLPRPGAALKSGAVHHR